jgi:hypothetical protein
LAPTSPNPSLIVQKFTINDLPIFIDPFGNLDPVEQGQGDGTERVAARAPA